MGILLLCFLAIAVVEVTSETEMCTNKTCDTNAISELEEIIKNTTKTLIGRIFKVEVMNRDLTKKLKRHRNRIKQLERQMETMSESAHHWKEWSEWSECTASCGVGKKWRYRECKQQKNESEHVCFGPSKMQLPCNIHSCLKEIYSEWSAWSEWTKCSASCGIGNRRRFRTCEERENATKNNCVGISKIQLPCRRVSCPIVSNITIRNKCSMTQHDRCFAIIDGLYPSPISWHAEQCEDNGGKLANIYDSSMLNMTMDFVSNQDLDSNYLWTGMTYSVQSGLKFSNESEADYAQWLTDYPSVNSTETAVVLRVVKKRGKSKNTTVSFGGKETLDFATVESAGIFNEISMAEYRYSICEFSNEN